VDSIEEALLDAVKALKGPKAVGVFLWPELAADIAAKRLNHCLDPDRPEKLELSQLLLIAKRARAVGCHTVMSFLAKELDYEWKPVDPETEQQRLMREFIVAQKALTELAARIEKRQAENPNLRRVA
jgi:hypothetical protein